MFSTMTMPEGLPVAVNDGLGSGEVVWHSDNSYTERPPAGSMLYALEVPPQGGDTAFSNQYLAYETLPPDLARRIEGLRAVHDASRNSAGVLRPGLAAPRSLAEVPGPLHPLVRTHPVTARRALYLGRRRAWPSQHIPSLPEAESTSVLDALWSHACDPSLVWSHQWRSGDLVMWDNRATMHRREPHDPRFPRIMHRVQIAGDEPR
jgi:taurine dioxygenase